MEDIQDVHFVELENSKYLKPIRMKYTQASRSECNQIKLLLLLLLAPQSGAYRDFHPTIQPIHPLIAFEHLSLYIQKHLDQSVTVRCSLWKGRSRQTYIYF